MTQKQINIGAAPDDGTGDPLRTAFTKINQNAEDVEVRLGGVENGGGGFATFDLMDAADLTGLDDGTIITAAGYRYTKVASGHDITISSGNVKLKAKGPIITPEQCGALGGAANDATALQVSANAAAREGAVWRLSQVYKTATQITVPAGMTVETVNGGAIDGSDITIANGAVVTFGGGDVTSLPALSGNVEKGKRAITFATAHGLAVGDYFAIYNPTNGSWHPSRDYYRAGEWCRVSDVVSNTAVTVDEPLYADYTAASVTCHKMNAAKYRFHGGFRAIANPSVKGMRAVLFAEVVETDLTGVHGHVKDGYTGIELSRCVDLYGTGLNGRQYGDSTAAVDYGLAYVNCQNLDLTGTFIGVRHGVTGTGRDQVAGVVNRNVTVQGAISKTGTLATAMAADHHANCEYCTYDGVIKGGVGPSGDHNKYQGTIIADEGGIAVYGADFVGCDMDFSGARIVSHYPVTAAQPGRGTVDIGGNSGVLTVSTTRGGLLDFSNTVWDVPGAIVHPLKLYNRGATPSEPIRVSLRGATFGKLNASLPYIARTSCEGGHQFAQMDLRDMLTDDGVSRGNLQGIGQILMGPLSGLTTVSITTATKAVTVPVTFSTPFPSVPRVVATINSPLTSEQGLLAYARNITTTGFDVEVCAADNSNFLVSADRYVSWSAGL